MLKRTLQIGSISCEYVETPHVSSVEVTFKAWGEVHTVKMSRDEALDLVEILTRTLQK